MEFEAENVGAIVLLHFLSNVNIRYSYYFHYLIDNKTYEKVLRMKEIHVVCSLLACS